jgi:hypothetical protein
MTTDDIERVRYYERQYLTAADFDAEQSYHRDMRRRHNLAHHTWGIVMGLDLVEKTEGSTLSVYLEPGMAVDGYGREIVVTAPAQLDPALFDRFNTKAHRQVWIAYDETDVAPPAFGFGLCGADNTMRRTAETWRLEIDPGSQIRDDIVVGGQVIGAPPTTPVPGTVYAPPDLSVPYQELPQEDVSRARWLVRLGSVNWDGADPVPQFIAAEFGRLDEGRSYLGAVAAELLAPQQSLTVRARLGPVADGALEFAKVEGPLRVTGRLVAERDVYVDSGVIRLNQEHGKTGDVDLWVGRTNDGTAEVLRIHLGDQSGPTSLSIGPGDKQAVLRVRADDVVEIAEGTLRFRGPTRQVVDLGALPASLDKPAYAIGLQPGVLYQRTGGGFAWFCGGDHSQNAFDPGDGATLMELSSTGTLQVHGGLYTDGDATVGHNSNRTLKVRHIDGKHWDSDNADNLYLNWSTNRDVHVGRYADGTANLYVSGNLHVHGSDDSAFRVRTYEMRVKNENTSDVPTHWTVDVGGQFTQVFEAFAALGGFSILDNTDPSHSAFDQVAHIADVRMIVQHCFVRVTSHTDSAVHGDCYCAQSDSSQEGSNTVLFTVVVIGRKA